MNWWLRLWRGKHMEDQLEKELLFHLEQHTEELIARGYTREVARRKARLALGGAERVKEECRDARGTRWLEDLLQDTRYALRMFRQKPGFAVTVLLILALGIGATTVMFTVINGVLLRPLAYPEADKLLTLRASTEQFGEFWGFSKLDFDDAKRDSRSLAMAAWSDGGGTISEPGTPEYVNGAQISAGFFSTLGINMVRGRTFRPDEDRPGAAPVAIISYGLWQRSYGGDRAAIGRPLVFEGKPYTVVGVAPAGSQLFGDADVFTPLAQTTDPRMQNRAARFMHVIARLEPGVKLTEARAELGLIGQHLAEQYPKSNAGLSLRAHPLQQELVGDVRSTLWLLLSAVWLVLLIACVNIASLLLARAVSRERELAMRTALGAAAGDQVLYEPRTMEQLVSASLARQRFLLLLFGIFGGLALLLACIGIYGVLAYLTSRRVPEMGVRMALGANARDVLWLVLRQSIAMVAIGAGVGLFAALAAGSMLRHAVEGVRPTEPATFAIMISVLVVAALLASFVPARRASLLDPVTALRQE